MADDQAYLDERELWNIVYAPGIPGWRERHSLERRFKRIFTHGHEESIRPLVEMVEKRVLSGESFRGTPNYPIRQIHPRALRLLVDYGEDYRPSRLWKDRPGTWDVQPMDGMCQVDAWQLMRYANTRFSLLPHMVYVEGITIGVGVSFMLHAWNARGLDGRNAIDWNHYTRGRWSRYLGIPFTQAEHATLLDLSEIRHRYHHLLFHGIFFEKAEPYLNELLAKRQALTQR